MNNRRNLLIALSTTLCAPRAAFAQAKKPPVVIGWLGAGHRSAEDLADFKKEFATLGWREGVNYFLEELYALGQTNRLPALAEVIAAKKPALIVAAPSVATIAAAKAAPKIPIVQATGNSPVDAGLVASLARPGGMITGLTSLSPETSTKYLELLLAVAPKVKRVGILADVTIPSYSTLIKNARAAVARFHIEARFAEVGSADELDRTFPQLVKEGVQALVVLPSASLFTPERQRIVPFALSHRWPVIAGAGWAAAGSLLSYSADNLALFRRAAHYVDRILKGAKPGDLPIEQPMRFDMVINMKTSKMLGLTIPPSVMVQATKLIE